MLDAGDFSIGISIGSNLYTPNSGIACSIINSVDPEEWATYKKKEKVLRSKIDDFLKTQQPARKKLSYVTFEADHAS